MDALMYEDSIKEVARKLEIKNVSILITGATGLIGSCIIDILITANKNFDANIKIYALARSKDRIMKRFRTEVVPIVQNIIEPLDNKIEYDYIIHGASNANPRTYALEPVETILTNIIGNRNVLDYCVKHLNTRMILTSTFEVYGEVRGCNIYTEDMSGVINQMVLRNGYPESKRCCELLTRSYVNEYGVNAVIARLPSVYGPTMLKTDSKAHAQFIMNALKGENIVLKSKGESKRTYCYVIDVASALFCILCAGQNGDIYNISNEKSVASIAEVAKTCAKIAGTKVVFDLPDEVEAKGFSQPNNCILNNSKLRDLGWEGKYSLKDGLVETLEYLRGN
ncbi:NAD-dependent epimerase/dehydratase family protein [Enterocloster bolteae]|uniref:NAD-dependent epimerase/dehydratase family protein n=1 Tax=Enterocloster bolteae TaxID=208479 RepID=UPI0021098ABD|nr:NAD-dependent epimerase/dehydratase family protein [Enterocloster bolteae]